MKEIRDIIRESDLAGKAGKKTALATVVHVEGSSYRRPGARMLVSEDGQLTGAISGGCLEGDALRKALQVITENRTRLITYDTNDEDDAKLGLGLGCNGIIQVLIEPIDRSDILNPVELLRQALEKREPAVLVTLFNLSDKRKEQPGTCLLVKPDKILESSNVIHKDTLIRNAKEVLADQRSCFKNYTVDNTAIIAFIEFIPVSTSIVIAGAGNDVMPLVQMSQLLGWDVTVVDGRNNLVKKERFPPGCQVLLTRPEDILKQVTIDNKTVFVLMTHNYNYDLHMIKELISRNAVYIGLLGPRTKRERIIEELEQNGMKLTTAQLASIHGPVGLDIGAETAEEIALSILAEIKGILTGREGTPLKKRTDPIHKRSDTSIENVNLKPE
jgi:xanthine dehydrogenase accessory factor